MVMMNNSGIHPVGDRILLKPEAIEETTAGGIILTNESVEQGAMAQVFGTLVARGKDCWSDYQEPFAEVGQRVMFAKYGGKVTMGKDGVTYRVMNDIDITATVDEDLGKIDAKPREPLRKTA
jgi:chaperonin GroES